MDVYDKATRSAVMRSVKGKNTKPEILVRRLLHQAGFRFRLHRTDLPGKPDMTLPKYRAAVFVHGCFWHQHPGCRFADRPASNKEYWQRKLNRNIERDEQNRTALVEMGWQPLIVWECELKTPDVVIQKLTESLSTCALRQADTQPSDS